VGRQDNFFELGGHSLLAVEISRRANQLGTPLTVRQIFESKTFAETCEQALIDGTYADAPPTGLTQATYHYNCVNPSDAIFLLPPAYSGAESYFKLVAELGPEVPIILLENIELYSQHSLEINELVQYYGKLVESLAPFGPYAVGGWSRGGQIAVALAAYLESRNIAPKRLLLLDPHVNEAISSEVYLAILRDPRVSLLDPIERTFLDGWLDLNFNYRKTLSPIHVRTTFFKALEESDYSLPGGTSSGERMLLKLVAIIRDYTQSGLTPKPSLLNGFEEYLEDVQVIPLSIRHNDMMMHRGTLTAIAKRIQDEVYGGLITRDVFASGVQGAEL
jgi:thioesterase domain-containing protein